jgi:hypothetical protein
MADVSEPPKIDVETLLRAAVESADVPKIYANSFGLGIGNADVFIVFQRFGATPEAVVNMSYTLAKTLAQRLGALVTQFEATIGQNILTTDRIDKAVQTAQEALSRSEQEAKSDEVH